MLATLAASAACIATHVHQDGIASCRDGDRYTSGAQQCSPFSRRFCGWNRTVLTVVTFVSLVALGVLMGSWWKAVLLLTLPGAWFVAHHPTCTDAVTMLLAWVAALLFPEHPYIACMLSIACGFIHERGPAFAALYAWHPLLLIGWVASGWWRTSRVRDPSDTLDKHVGHSFLEAIRVHRPYVDLLDGMSLWYGFRMVLPLWAVWGWSTRSLVALAMAFGSRVMGTDTCRYLWWAAPPLIAGLDVPPWAVLPAVAVHLVTFRRAI